VTVAALVNGNDIVNVVDARDDHGSMSFVSMATMRSSKSTHVYGRDHGHGIVPVHERGHGHGGGHVHGNCSHHERGRSWRVSQLRR
jgi:hypothetical protein